MPISVTTFPANSTITAADMRSRVQTIENYVNGGIVQGDRTTNWLSSGHVYTPDFQYGYGNYARLPMTGGQLHWNMLPGNPNLMSVFTFQTGNGYVQAPGLTRTIQVPEATNSRYRAMILASFWIYEYGGGATGGTTTAAPPFLDESTYQAGTAALTINGVLIAATERPFYSASDATATTGGGATSGMIYCHKQYGIVYPFNWQSAGVFSVGVSVSSPTPADDEWKHIFIQEGSLYVRYRLR